MAKLGIMTEGQTDLTWERWHETADLVERLGFESLWRSDHLYDHRGDGRMEALEAWTSFATLADRTSRIRFGPMVTPITFRHPSLLAKMSASIDQLSGGRLEMALGVGSVDVEHGVFGIPCPPLPVRYQMLEEGIKVILALWTEDSASFKGEHYSLDNAVCYPKPAQKPRPPIIIGGNGERRTLPLAAVYADEWNGDALTPDAYREKRQILQGHCQRNGRDFSSMRCSWTGPVLIGRDETEIMKRLQRIKGLMGNLPEMASVSPKELSDDGWAAGTPSQVIEKIEALAEAGSERFILELFDNEDHEVIELIAEEVLPAVEKI